MLRLGARSGPLSRLWLESDAAQRFASSGIRWHLGRPWVRQVGSSPWSVHQLVDERTVPPILPGDHKRHDFFARWLSSNCAA
jgi:hypothetical protein